MKMSKEAKVRMIGRNRWKALGILNAIMAGLVISLSAPVFGQTIDELHKLALKEGGTLNFYATLGANQRREEFCRYSRNGFLG